MVVGALVLSAIGLTREGFPPSRTIARAIIAGTALLVFVGAATLLIVTDKEHPREEAAEKAELAAERSQGENPEGAVQGEGGGKTVRAVEDEFSIKLAGGNSLKADKYRFSVVNKGKIDHDLAIQGQGLEEKTALIGSGEEAALEADLKAGKYRFWCTVPGHAQSGMDIDVSVE
jgi:plastocyanin